MLWMLDMAWSWRAVLLAAGTGLAAVLSTGPAGADGDPGEPGRIVRVTLYRGQALVTRELTVDGPAGTREVVVSNLPLHVEPNSLYAESGEGLEIRAVRFRQTAVGEEPREEVRSLDQQIATGQAALNLVNKKIELAAQKTAYLDQLQGFVAPTAGTELSSGVLNAETLRDLTRFSFEERTRIAEEQVQLALEQTRLQEEISVLQRKRAELTAGAQRTVNEAVLFLEKPAAGAQKVELNYLVRQCGWAPGYNLRAAADAKQIQVEYNALIQQVTGEDWSNVQLTLSTASPALSAAGPSLAPFAVALAAADQQMQLAATLGNGTEIAMQFRANRAAQAAGNHELSSKIGFDDRLTTNWTVNSRAMFCQQMELTNPLEMISSLLADDDAAAAPTLSYRLPNAVSLTSRSDQQMVRICQCALASNLYHVATPQLNSYAFREAEILNDSESDFLAGPVAVYLDGRFVGRTEIPTVARGETFVVGFGADAQLRARRELADRKESVQGGNREIRMEYRITVENYRQQPVSVRVMDRLPWSSRPGDVRVTLTGSDAPLSDDAVYLRRERTKNILRWDVSVPPTGSGGQPWSLTYAFTLDHDRNFALADASGDQTAVNEFRELERMRLKK